ncbi:MAG: putative periplasmic linker protein [Ramlibacter sp.]|nr:putative periplasmic linker protein [Ramlibacter sp.]
MASKSIYTVVAIAGIAAASGAAWWLQQPRQAGGTEATAAAPARGKGVAGPSAAAASASRVPAVEAARVETVRITDDAQAVGSLRSRQSVMLRPEVSGRVTQINFRDADRVKRGQVLVQLDDQLPMAQVRQAEAEVSIARANHRRNRELVEEKFIAQRAVDESAANLQVAEAKLALARATLARLKILAPFDGVAGIRSINVGDYLKDGADIVNIEDLDALYVDFRLPERLQTRIRPGQTAMVDVDALPGQRFTAVIQAIDPLVDANGRSVGVRGCVDNRHLKLRPGMFARIAPIFNVRENARMIPEEAIVPQGGRQFVYRLVDGPDQDTSIAQRVEVTVGVRQPGKVEVVSGLAPGDLVVTAGQQRIQKDGTPVRVLDLSGRNGARGAAAAGGPPARDAQSALQVVANRPGNPCAVASGARGGLSAPASRPIGG